MLGNVFGSDLDAVVNLTAAQVKTIITSRQIGRNWKEAVASAKGIGEIQAKRLLKELPTEIFTGIALDLVLKQLIPNQADTSWTFDIGLSALTTGVKFVLTNFVEVSAEIANPVGLIFAGVLGFPQKITDAESYPYLMVFNGKAALGRVWDADTAQNVVDNGGKAAADKLYMDIANYYREMRDNGTFTDSKYNENLDHLDEFYNSIRNTQLQGLSLLA